MPMLLACPADDSVKEPDRFTQQRPQTFLFFLTDTNSTSRRDSARLATSDGHETNLPSGTAHVQRSAKRTDLNSQ
jgi:hypothetical protein